MNFRFEPLEPIYPFGVDCRWNFGYVVCVGVYLISRQCIGHQQVKRQVECDLPEGFCQMQLDGSPAPPLIQPVQERRAIECLFCGIQRNPVARRDCRCIDRLAVRALQVSCEEGNFLNPKPQKTKPEFEKCGSDSAGNGIQNVQSDYIARACTSSPYDAKNGPAGPE